MSLKDVFFQISEGDTVHVKFQGHREYETEVELVTNEDEGKRVVLSLTQDQPTLVIKHDRVMIERRPLGHSREWSSYEEINNLEIIS